jgi:uncharacterized protein (DUF58 family)
MRQAMRGLTTRGRSFLGAGAAAALCSMAFGQRDLLRAAILVLALPVISALVVSRTRYRLASSRRMEPARTPAGQEARVVLRLENVSRLPTGLLLLEDRIPYLLGARPRFVLDRVEPQGVREVAYAVRSDLRGRFSIGPLTIRLTDPFGMCELVRSFTSTDTFVVTPVIERLPSLALGGEWTGSGDSRSRSIAAAGEDDVITREYRRGDDLRRVHWRSTAKYGELMVRREEQPWESRAVVLLDARAAAHRGEGPASSFEVAVSVAASVGVHLGHAGFTVELVTDSGTRIGSAVGDDLTGTHEELLLDALAVVDASSNRTLRTAGPILRAAGDGLTVAVVGALSVEEAANLVRMRHGTGGAAAIVLDVDSWRSPIARERAAAIDSTGPIAVLRAGGWRVVPLSAGQPLSGVWPLIAHSYQGAVYQDTAAGPS